jgi:hypothetical protein
MHPTRIISDVIHKIEGLRCCVRAGDAGRSVVARPLMRVESKPLVPRLKAVKVEIGYQSSGVVLLKVHRSSQVIASP